MLQKILVGVDGSEYSQKALELACQLTEKFNGSLHIVHVPQGAAADRVMVLGGARGSANNRRVPCSSC